MPRAGRPGRSLPLGETDRPWRSVGDLVERARAGSGGALVVRGQAAGGKSALAERAERYARELGIRVLRLGRPEPGRRFGALATLVADLAPARASLSTLQDGLLGSVLEGPAGVRAGLPMRQAVLALLEAAADGAPLLLIADDVDRWDEASRSVLEYAAYRFGRRPLSLLATETAASPARPSSGASGAAGTSGTSGEEAGPAEGDGRLRGLPVETMPPLNAAGARRLLAGQGIVMDDDQLAALLAATGGHALGLLDLAPLAAAGKFDAGCRTPVPLTPRLAALFEPCLAGLDGLTRQALLFLAANQMADLSPVVGALRAAGSSTAAFEAAEAAGVVVGAPTYRFGHPLLRSAVYHGASAAERADAHRRLAAALAQRVRPAAVGQRAWHRSFAETPPDAAVAAELAGVGRQELGRRRPAPAREAFARAAEFAPHPRERAALLAEAARCARLLGRASEASAWLATAGDLLRADGLADAAGVTPEETGAAPENPGHPPTTRRALAIRVEAERARLDRYHGDAADAFVRCDRMARDPLVAGTPDAPVLVLDAVVAGILAQNPLGALAVAEWARPAFADDHELLPVLRILSGYLRILIGEGEAGLGELRAGIAAPYDTRADTGIHAAVYGIRAFALLDRHAEAQALAYKALRLALHAEACGLMAPLLVAIADADVRAGRWSAALEHALGAVGTAHRLGQAAVRAEAHATAAWVTALRDEWGRARTHLARAERAFAASGSRTVNARFVLLAAHAAAEDAVADERADSTPPTADMPEGWHADTSPGTAPTAVSALAPLLLVTCDVDNQVPAPARSRSRRAEEPAPSGRAAAEQAHRRAIAAHVAPALAEALATLRERGIVEEACQPLRAGLVSVLLAAGEDEVARRCFAEGEEEPTASPSVRAARARTAALLVVRGLLPERTAQAAEAHSAINTDATPAADLAAPSSATTKTPRPVPDPRAAYERALALLTPACDPFEAARTRLAFGAWLQRARRLDEARPHLDQAAAGFRRLGADGWAARVDAEVGAALRAVREAGAAERFSDREREIARLIASGMTDKQAAATLFLSPRTIEYHLRSLYRKLGIRTRTQLAAIVAEWG